MDSDAAAICGQGVGTTADGDLCTFCGFPMCRPCYEYNRKDDTQACPQCKTNKRHQGLEVKPRFGMVPLVFGTLEALALQKLNYKHP
ncbi:cellulose synthase/ transferase transferring glycosyl groups [Zea mays]|uniref:Cellulose synthase/ transferase transferring glycosyl groups n=1 Tax=Zea mays TaxID=4577 RepID=A0A1D6PC68_MAIZE|nr:cellulose synthase/ transferase transferring glycosyl groups [Zea mays]